MILLLRKGIASEDKALELYNEKDEPSFCKYRLVHREGGNKGRMN